MVTAVFAAASPAQEMTRELLSRSYEEISPAVCLINYSSEITNLSSGVVNRRNSNSMGLIVAPDGLIIAHGHMVLENSQPFNIRVTVGEGDNEKKYDAEVLKKPDDVNVVFLRIQSDEELDLPYVTFDIDVSLGLGEEISMIGVLGSTLDYSRAIYTRRIGSVLEKPRTTYCIDDAISFGFVGAPVINGEGKVVGITGFDLSSTEGGDLYVRSGHPLIYQAELFQGYIDNPPAEEDGENDESDAWIGIFTQPLTDDLAEYWGLEKDGGIVVSTIMPGSPAEMGGLQRGDVIVNFDGTPIKAKLDREVLGFTKLVREAGPNKEVALKLFRDMSPMDLSITLGERPKGSRDAGEFTDTIFGLTVREITTDVRIQLNLADDVQGVMVRRVKSGSSANIAGIRPGMIVLNFADIPVSSIENFEKASKQVAAKKPKEFTVFCKVGPRTRFFRVEPRWNRDGQ